MAIAKAGDVNLEYVTEGKGPPLLLIMGFAGQASSWGEPFLRGLRDHFTVIRFSNRGTGLSEMPPQAPTVRLMADDAANLLAAIGVEKAHVMGISMGGMIAQELAINHSERVAGLVLGCTTCGFTAGAHASPETIALLMPAPGLSLQDQIRKAWPAMCSPAFIETGRQFLEEMLVSSLVNPTPMETLMKQGVAVQAFNACDRLSQVKSPVLIIQGDADRLVPPHNADVLAERLPGAKVKVVPGAGHMFFWEQPEESARAVVEFLAKVPSPA